MRGVVWAAREAQQARTNEQAATSAPPLNPFPELGANPAQFIISGLLFERRTEKLHHGGTEITEKSNEQAISE